MSRGGHNWKGGGTVEETRSLDVMQLRRAGFLAGCRRADWRWSCDDGMASTIGIEDGKESITLRYSVKSNGKDWQSLEQKVPVCWTGCRFGGARPWFVCACFADGVHCGRRVTKLYVGGRLFACRRCYRLGYASQRGDRMDQAHHRLARLHRKLRADYHGPDMPPPPKPKWMRRKTYTRIADQIEAGQERMEMVFTAGAQRTLARLEKIEQRSRARR